MNALLVFKSKSAEILKIHQTAKDSGAICQSVCEGHQLMTKVTISQERVVWYLIVSIPHLCTLTYFVIGTLRVRKSTIMRCEKACP